MVLSGRDAEQRYPTLRGMLAAKKKPLRTVTVPAAETESGRLAWTAPVHVDRPATGTILEGVPVDEAAAQLVAWLKERRLV
jgi:electron transfer flavoprotein alpha/beta subunit